MNKKIFYHRSFKRAYKKRIRHNKKLAKRVGERIKLFNEDRRNRILNDHQLKGVLKDYRSFSITGDVRIKYREYPDHFKFVDIGTHPQVY